MQADVIIVGAGPAGLMLAGELRTAGVSVTVLERLPAPTGESRGLGFTARTMEVFDQRGLLSRFDSVPTTNQGHFGGLPLDFGVVKGAHFGAKMLPQAKTEEMLAGWATDLGADIRRGWAVTGLTDHGDRVTVDVVGPHGPDRLTAGWLVGCDGGRSTVRKAAGFDFPGTAASMEMFLADLKGVPLRPRMIGETFPNGMVMCGHITEGGIQRIIVCERGTPPQKRTEPIQFPEIAAAWQRLTGEDIAHAEPVWMSSFGDATRQAGEYRRGRVLLAGDAAHIHLPAGGLGMNTSIQDSVNLGWKLAAVVTGSAPAGLLDTYHEERHAVGERLLMNTQAQGLLFLSGTGVQPLRDLFTELMQYEVVTRHLVGMVSQLEVRYDVGPGEHPLLGKRLPNVLLSVEGRDVPVYEFLHAGRGLLIDLAGDTAFGELAEGWSDRVGLVAGGFADHHAAADLAAADLLLVRPDGHIVWAWPGATDTVGVALERWFGEPVTLARAKVA